MKFRFYDYFLYFASGLVAISTRNACSWQISDLARGVSAFWTVLIRAASRCGEANLWRQTARHRGSRLILLCILLGSIGVGICLFARRFCVCCYSRIAIFQDDFVRQFWIFSFGYFHVVSWLSFFIRVFPLLIGGACIDSFSSHGLCIDFQCAYI